MHIKKILPSLLASPLIVLLFFLSSQKVEPSKPKVIIRFDDYGVWCNKDWLNIEEELIRLHAKYDIKLTCAVIPDSRYPIKRHILSPQSYPDTIESTKANPYPLIAGCTRTTLLCNASKTGNVEIALHGYYHPKGYSNTDKNTEYYKIPYDVQYYKLQEGKHLLDSLFQTNCTTFVPPHNTYDNLTLDLLTEFGFNCISAKKCSYDAPMDTRLPIRYLEYTTADCQEFKKSLTSKEHYTNEYVHILQLHHTNFTTDGHIDTSKLHDYERILKYIRDFNIPNYTFANFPIDQNANNELYTKTLYQALAAKGLIREAEQITKMTSLLSTTSITLLFITSMMLAIGGIFFSLLNLLNILFHRRILAYSLYTITLGITLYIIYTILHAYSISCYNLYYYLLTFKLNFLLYLFAVLASASLHCHLYKNKNVFIIK